MPGGKREREQTVAPPSCSEAHPAYSEASDGLGSMMVDSPRELSSSLFAGGACAMSPDSCSEVIVPRVRTSSTSSGSTPTLAPGAPLLGAPNSVRSEPSTCPPSRPELPVVPSSMPMGGMTRGGMPASPAPGWTPSASAGMGQQGRGSTTGFARSARGAWPPMQVQSQPRTGPTDMER